MNRSAADAALVVFAVAPHALGGVRLRAPAGMDRDAWLAGLKVVLPEATPWRRMPVTIGDEALLGGLDLAATLAAGRPVAQAGLLSQAKGGIVVAAMAERMGPALASRLTATLDGGAKLAIVALDEGLDDESPPASLLDRLALHVQPERDHDAPDRGDIERARDTWPHVEVSDALFEALVAAAASLGIPSMRAACHAVVVTRIAAALDGRQVATQEDAALAARLVLAPRATQLPPAPNPPPPPEPPPESQTSEPPADDENTSDQPLEDRVIAAAVAAIPPGLLALLAANPSAGPRRGDAGRAGQATRSQQRGRPVGAQRGEPRSGARLALVDTLRAAAPWQSIRRAATTHAVQRVLVSRDDLRVQRRVQRRATTTIFAIDASGSQALHRLAEAKGAVELLLAECYARRDRVAVIGFRGDAAQLLLSPTRSLVRAKRQLSGLPGGGGTPLADGIDAATALAAVVRRGGATPLVVLLTDGRANVARGGVPGRVQASLDALAAARALNASGTPALLIDTSAQASPAARALADAMHARCVALPHADAGALSVAVRHVRDSVGTRNA